MGLGIFVWLPSSRKRLAILATLRTSAICLGWWLDKLPHCCPTQLLQETLLSVEVLPPARSGWLSPQAVDWVTCSSKAISSAFFPHNYPRTTPLPELSPEHDQSSFSSAFTQKFNNGTPPPPPPPRTDNTTKETCAQGSTPVALPGTTVIPPPSPHSGCRRAYAVKVLVAQSSLTLRCPRDCSPPGSSAMGFSRQEY